MTSLSMSCDCADCTKMFAQSALNLQHMQVKPNNSTSARNGNTSGVLTTTSSPAYFAKTNDDWSYSTISDDAGTCTCDACVPRYNSPRKPPPNSSFKTKPRITGCGSIDCNACSAPVAMANVPRYNTWNSKDSRQGLSTAMQSMSLGTQGTVSSTFRARGQCDSYVCNDCAQYM